MNAVSSTSRITAVRPLWAVEGGQVTIVGRRLPGRPARTRSSIGGAPARVAAASSQDISVIVPAGLDGGRTPVRLEGAPGETAYIDVGAPLATGLHLVDNPGVRSQRQPLRHVQRLARATGAGLDLPGSPDGPREPFVGDLPNPTSMAFDREGMLLRLAAGSTAAFTASTPDGTVAVVCHRPWRRLRHRLRSRRPLFVGDRSGSILRVEDGRATLVASVPPSVAAFHLAFGPDGSLYRDRADAVGTGRGLSHLADGEVEIFQRRLRPPARAGLRRPGSPLRGRRVAGGARSTASRLDRRGSAAAGHRRRRSRSASPSIHAADWCWRRRTPVTA